MKLDKCDHTHTLQAKCGGDETPAIKKVKKKAVKPKEKKPKRMTTIEYRNKFRAKKPQQQWVVKTAQGEGREKNEKISPTSSDDDKLSAGREATRHKGRRSHIDVFQGEPKV